MKKEFTTIIFFLLIAGNMSAQKYLTKNGHVNFYSKAPLENIEADNHQANSIVDLETGEMAYSLLMKGFHFDKALMEEHFNDKYVHSNKFPKSTFKGTISNIDNIDPEAEGPQTVHVEGMLTIHGLSHEISTSGTIEMLEDKLYANAIFEILLEDYDIVIPRAVKNNISPTIQITISMIYEPYVN